MENIRNILWDFDGVILNSNAVRDKGFQIVLGKYPSNQVQLLLDYHRRNGGLSRYNKFRHFFEKIRGEEVTENKILDLSCKFSIIMLKELGDQKLLIEETLKFIEKNNTNYQMHIVSGSDQTELQKLCKVLGINSYFKSIHGSPTPKDKLVQNLILTNQYVQDECVLIGDSINDFEAAHSNGIKFCGYNTTHAIKNLTNYEINFHLD
jgi:HAD superfamily hydrolase (TIGR01549 family)